MISEDIYIEMVARFAFEDKLLFFRAKI